MTRKEAIKHLETYSTTIGSGQTSQAQHEEANRMGIKALEQEPKTGHWEHIRCEIYECSECKHVYTDLSGEYKGMNYCPNCGADMREPQEREDKE